MFELVYCLLFGVREEQVLVVCGIILLEGGNRDVPRSLRSMFGGAWGEDVVGVDGTILGL